MTDDENLSYQERIERLEKESNRREIGRDAYESLAERIEKLEKSLKTINEGTDLLVSLEQDQGVKINKNIDEITELKRSFDSFSIQIPLYEVFRKEIAELKGKITHRDLDIQNQINDLKEQIGKEKVKYYMADNWSPERLEIIEKVLRELIKHYKENLEYFADKSDLWDLDIEKLDGLLEQLDGEGDYKDLSDKELYNIEYPKAKEGEKSRVSVMPGQRSTNRPKSGDDLIPSDDEYERGFNDAIDQTDPTPEPIEEITLDGRNIFLKKMGWTVVETEELKWLYYRGNKLPPNYASHDDYFKRMRDFKEKYLSEEKS